MSRSPSIAEQVARRNGGAGVQALACPAGEARTVSRAELKTELAAMVERATGTPDARNLKVELQLAERALAHWQASGLPAPQREYRFHPERKWRFDFAWPDHRLEIRDATGQVVTVCEIADVTAKDACVAEHVTNVKPQIEALAMDEAETGIALFSSTHISIDQVKEFCARTPEYHCVMHEEYPPYTTEPAASDALDDAILKRLPIGYDIVFTEGLYWISRTDQDSEHSVVHADKKIARVMFAEKLFAKP